MSEVTSLNGMQIGDCISCEYTASSNTFGTFANLGTATKDFIPASSSATPNGSFYFIFVGYDHLGRMKLVADRNIQSSISWDKLNEAGIASGENIISIDNKKYAMRLLSGGVSATDKDNEWDKIISEYNLNGTITAGDNTIWNWSQASSWTSSTPTTGNTYRAARGYSSLITRYDNLASSTSSTTRGFRPVLLADPNLFFSSVSFTDKTYNQDIDIVGSVGFVREVLDIRYRYSLNGVDQSWSSFGNYTSFNISVSYTSLEYGVNNIKISVESEDGNLTETTIKVTRVITELLQPQYVYFDKVTLDWLPILSPEKISSLYLKKTGSQNIYITGESYNDTSLIASTTYTYKIAGISNSIEIESNPINITTPSDAAFYYVWENGAYVLKEIEGLAFEDANGDYYTAPNGIKIKPLDIGNLVGGRQSNIFGFEVSNTYEIENFNIELRVSRNGTLAEDMGDYGLLYDAVNDRHRTEVTFSLDGVTYTPDYPLITYLGAGQKKTVYMKLKPSILTNGQETIQVLMTGRRA